MVFCLPRLGRMFFCSQSASSLAQHVVPHTVIKTRRNVIVPAELGYGLAVTTFHRRGVRLGQNLVPGLWVTLRSESSAA